MLSLNQQPTTKTTTQQQSYIDYSLDCCKIATTSAKNRNEFVSPLMDEKVAKFELPIPYSQPNNFQIRFICEIASRLLFLSVHWIKNVPSLALKFVFFLKK